VADVSDGGAGLLGLRHDSISEYSRGWTRRIVFQSASPAGFQSVYHQSEIEHSAIDDGTFLFRSLPVYKSTPIAVEVRSLTSVLASVEYLRAVGGTICTLGFKAALGRHLHVNAEQITYFVDAELCPEPPSSDDAVDSDPCPNKCMKLTKGLPSFLADKGAILEDGAVHKLRCRPFATYAQR
jgi:hypothetical protein